MELRLCRALAIRLQAGPATGRSSIGMSFPDRCCRRVQEQLVDTGVSVPAIPEAGRLASLSGLPRDYGEAQHTSRPAAHQSAA